MVTHAKLQYYKQNYCLVCMTGLLGCRWHRYKQSTRDSRKRDLAIYSLLLATFLFIDFLLYYTLISKNDADSLNWYMFLHLKEWISFYTVMLAVFVTLFCYVLLLMILSMCHVLNGHQLYTHPVHTVFVVICLCICIALTVAVDELWRTEWAVVWFSLKIFGPFLQIAAVAIMTASTWIIAKQWLTLSSCCLQFVWLIVYLIIMVGLYISPLFINSPCIKVLADIPPKPKVIGHRGAPALAPENTLISFETALKYGVFGLEGDIKISSDGVPFLFHDTTLRRTTNIADVFPNDVDSDISNFNISAIKQLNAGSWFLEVCVYYPSGKKSVLITDPAHKTICKAFLGKDGAKTDKVIVDNLCKTNPSEIIRGSASIVGEEAKVICKAGSVSTLRKKDHDAVLNFNWEQLYSELEAQCPWILTIISAIISDIPPSVDNKQFQNIILTTGMALHSRNHEMSLLQYVTGFILTHGGCTQQRDPFGTVGEMSEEEKHSFKNITIPTLYEVLSLVNKSNAILLADLHEHRDHNSMDIVMKEVNKFVIPPNKIWITGDRRNYNVTSVLNDIDGDDPIQYTLHNNYSIVNFEPYQASQSDILNFKRHNISTNVYLVNTVWLYSFYWCLGVSSVTTDTCHLFPGLEEPLWHLPPKSYLILWISVDILSALAVITIFIVQRIHNTKDIFNPENVSLNSRARISGNFNSTRSRRSMKEKLLLKDVTDIFDDPEEGDYGIEANYTVQSLDGAVMARQFKNSRRVEEDRIELT